jgi:hypothetical protein
MYFKIGEAPAHNTRQKNNHGRKLLNIIGNIIVGTKKINKKINKKIFQILL